MIMHFTYKCSLNGPKFHQFDSVRRVFENSTSKGSGEPTLYGSVEVYVGQTKTRCLT